MEANIRYLNRSEIDVARWNRTLDGCPNRMVYAYTWFLDQVAPDWAALVMEDYSAIMPLPVKRKYLVDYVFTPPYCQQLGLFSHEPVDEHLLGAFLKAIPSRIKFVDYRLNFGNSCIPAGITYWENKNLVLKLAREYEEVAAGFSTNHRRNIRKAIESGLVVEESEGVEQVISIFESGRGARLKSNPDKGHLLLRTMVAGMQKLGKVKIMLARSESGAIVGGAVFLMHEKGAYFIFSGVSDEGRKCSAMHLIVSAFIRSFGQDLDFLDFEGSNDPDLARFYSGFGASESLYLRIVMNRLPLVFRWLKG